MRACETCVHLRPTPDGKKRCARYPPGFELSAFAFGQVVSTVAAKSVFQYHQPVIDSPKTTVCGEWEVGSPHKLED